MTYMCVHICLIRYAIHNSGKVGLTLKKVGDSNNEVRTQATSSVQDNVKFLYSPAIARELLEYNHKDELLKFTASGFITNPNYNIKKMNFLLFINHRLVESSAMKKAIELIYAAYLPKGTHPFVYLSLNIAPENIDVNVCNYLFIMIQLKFDFLLHFDIFLRYILPNTKYIFCTKMK